MPKNITNLLKAIEKKKKELTKDRDDLRAIVEEAEDLLDSFDRGIEEIEIGLRAFQDAIDSMSEYV